jgi:hypothetical protein
MGHSHESRLLDAGEALQDVHDMGVEAYKNKSVRA